MDPFPLTPAAFSGEPRLAPPECAFNWLRQGWAIFIGKPGLWLAISLLLILIFLGLQIVPVVGAFATNLLLPILGAGMLHAVRRAADGDDFEIGDLFAGFKRNTGQLVMLGVIYMVAWLIIGLLVLALAGGSIAGMVTAAATGQLGLGAGIGLGGIFMAMLLSLLLGAPLVMAMWFAPALVYFNDMDAISALKASLAANLKNWLVLLIFGLIVSILCFFAVLPMGLGLLVLIPVLNGALYASYKDIFLG